MEQSTPLPDFSFEIPHQPSYSRGQLLLRTFFGFIYMALPHFFLLFFIGIAAAVLRFISWWAVLFTGQYPKSFFDFQVSMLRWAIRLQARILNLADGYPAFGLNGSDDKTQLHIGYPEKLSRGILILRLFFGVIYVVIPHLFLLFFRVIATYVIIFIAWWAVLFTGKYPQGMHDFVTGTLRWGARVQIYMTFMTDKYPPFSSK